MASFCSCVSWPSISLPWRNVIQNKLFQQEKNKYINTYMWNLEKWYRRLFAGQRERNRYRKQTCEHGVGGDGWDELGDLN